MSICIFFTLSLSSYSAVHCFLDSSFHSLKQLVVFFFLPQVKFCFFFNVLKNFFPFLYLKFFFYTTVCLNWKSFPSHYTYSGIYPLGKQAEQGSHFNQIEWSLENCQETCEDKNTWTLSKYAKTEQFKAYKNRHLKYNVGMSVVFGQLLIRRIPVCPSTAPIKGKKKNNYVSEKKEYFHKLALSYMWYTCPN